MSENRVLIKNADWIITMDEHRTMLKKSDILICNGLIEKLGKDLETDENACVVDATGSIVIPGMINTHHHCSHTLIRNMPNIYKMPLSGWLQSIYSMQEYYDEEVIFAATLGALGDLLKTGCTTSIDHHYVFPKQETAMVDAQIKAAQKLGIRFHAMRGVLSTGAKGGCPHVPESLVESVSSMEKDSVRLIEKYHSASKGSMIQIGIAPCWLVFETKDMLGEARRLSECYGVSLHSHLADSRNEYTFSMEKHGCSPTEFADKIGYLKKNNFFAHCIQLSRSDLSLIAKSKAGVSHCPTSDMVLRSGVAKVAEFMRRDIPVGLGVDGAASNNTSNIIAEMKSAYLIQQSLEIQREKESEQQNIRNTKSLTPEEVLYISTAGGAKVLGRTDIGYLASGMMADLVVLNWSKLPYAGGKNDPIAAIVFSGDARMIEHVFVNGKQVVKHGMLTGIDEKKATDYINKCAAKLRYRYQNHSM